MCKKITYGALLGLLGFAAFELLYKKRDKSGIEVLKEHKISWELIADSEKEKTFCTNLLFRNYNSKYQGTLVKFETETKILFKNEYLDELKVESKIVPKIEAVRKDEYVPSFLVDEMTNVDTSLTVKFTGKLDLLKEVHALVVKIKYQTYERTGISNKEKDIILVPYQDGIVQNFEAKEESGAKIYPVKTHLLTESDDLAEVITKYAGDFLKEGDVVVIAESPIAITQGRFNQPNNMKLSYFTKRICYFIPSAGSLASPYGMQSAVNQIGELKFIYALIGGAIMKVLGKNGWFYTLAGMESELIDDLTGTIPPYDKYIVLGPKNPQDVVNNLKAKIGADVAIADANDLKKARILASTLSDSTQIRTWLLGNPAGNDNQQTPIVIIRPDKAN